jgi:hypothetical protein
MDDQIEHLAKLQAVVLERARFEQLLQKLPEEFAQAHRTLKAAQQKVDAATGFLAKEEKLRAELELTIAAHRDKAARLRVQIDTVKTPEQAAALEHEIEFASSEADRLDNEAFASLERSEAQEAALQPAQAEVTEATANLAVIRKGIASRQQEYLAGVKAQQAEAVALRARVDPDLLAEFDRIGSKRGGLALVRAENQQCPGCRMGIRLQVWLRLREGATEHCDSCGRILYWDPVLAPAAEEERPSLAPGQGRAVRRTRPA